MTHPPNHRVWFCPSCGHRNERSNLVEEKVCEKCGYGELPDLPDDEEPPAGYE